MKLRRDGKRERGGFARVGKVIDTFKGRKMLRKIEGESKHIENKINFGRARHKKKNEPKTQRKEKGR